MTTPAASRRVDRGLFAFYAAVALIALAGQTGAAHEWLGWPVPAALMAVAAAEFGGIVLSAYADHRRQLGERAYTARALSAAVAAGAVALNWFGHHDRLQGGFFAGMSALGYAVWLLHSGARRRDQLRAVGDLPPVAPVYGWLWLRHPGLTRRARALALADATLGLYGSLAAARAAARAERRQAGIAALLRRKLAEGRDPLAAEIAVAVYDLDQVAARLAAGADYDGLTALIAADLTPARLADGGATAAGTRPGDDAAGGQMSTELAVAAAAGVVAEPAEAHPQVAPEPPAEVAAGATATSVPAKTRRPAAKPRTSGRKKTATTGAGKRESSPRRSAEQTRQLAAQLRTQHPEVTKTELARLLGISATRLRQVEAGEVRPVNGTPVPNLIDTD